MDKGSDKLRYNGITGKGKVRLNNEDSIYLPKDDEKYFIVADGMGGHLGGEIASAIAVEFISERLKGVQFESLEDAKVNIGEIITLANMEIYNKSMEHAEFRGMGTTLSLVYLFEDNKLLYSNIGDSRIYLVEEENLKQITVDDSLVNYLVKIGEINEQEALVHPKKNVLTQALGTMNKIDCKVCEEPLEDKAKYILLCSDGLTNMVSNDAIKNIIANNSFEDAVEVLMEKALENGGVDNISIILIDVRR